MISWGVLSSCLRKWYIGSLIDESKEGWVNLGRECGVGGSMEERMSRHFDCGVCYNLLKVVFGFVS